MSAIAATGLSGRSVTCATNELATVQPPSGMTCGEYLNSYASAAKGSIYNPSATSDCHYCSISTADDYLAGSGITYSTRWRNYGIGFAFIFFNIVVAVVLYYLVRVRKGSGMSFSERLAPIFGRFQKKPKDKINGAKEKTATQEK